MRTFRLSCAITVSAQTIVEARTLDEAIEIAEGRDVVIGGVGCGSDETEDWVIDDADGLPEDIHNSDG